MYLNKLILFSPSLYDVLKPNPHRKSMQIFQIAHIVIAVVKAQSGFGYIKPQAATNRNPVDIKEFRFFVDIIFEMLSESQ